MKILLICANGLSTSILMQKMEKWGKQKDIDLSVKAVPIGGYEGVYQDYDCILVAPQISYKLDEVKKNAVGKPVGKIDSVDYGMGNVANIMKSVHSYIEKGA
ncbi:PTS system cellobiose-specific EIIB component [bioreactor metagenome]|uniref:PTS system cellobiose-specific EIIB component n=1 Tax=bioreactor metagenome TaxID=1076179 RepID=A0A645HAN9_9ZZZZ